MAEWPSGTVTFLFTDLEGSTQRWQQYPAAMGPALARHDRLVREAISAHGGVVFKTVGDAVCAAFATAPAAVAAALTAQRALYGEPWGATGPLRVRMALHTGQAEAQAGDYLGGPLNRVARLLASGHGGQVLLSGPTADLVQDYLPPGVALLDLGTHRLKDLHRPEHVFQLVAPDLPSDFAPLATGGPAPPQADPRPAPSDAGRHRMGRRRIAVAAAAVLAATLVGALMARWVVTGDGGQGAPPPAAGLAATGPPAIPSTPSPTATATVLAVSPVVPGDPTAEVASILQTPSSRASPVAASVLGARAESGRGLVVYKTHDGQAGDGRLYRVAANEGATPENLSAALDSLAAAAPDTWINISPDGRWLLLGTERFDPECAGWPCLAVVPADLSVGEAVRAAGELVHPAGRAAIGDGDLIVYPAGGGPHELDLWAIRRRGDSWDAPLLLTGDSPYAYHAEPGIAADSARVVFECGDRPYGEEGTALCEVATDGIGFRVVLTPADAPAGLPPIGALRHPGYAPDGGIVFAAVWDGAIWRLPLRGTPEPVGLGFANDNAPCVLPDGRVASLWLARPGGQGRNELKVMAPDGSSYVMLAPGVDVEDIGCGE